MRLLGLRARERTGQIARELQISPATVEKHLEHIYQRLAVTSRSQALARVDS